MILSMYGTLYASSPKQEEVIGKVGPVEEWVNLGTFKLTCYYLGEDEWGDSIAHPCSDKHKAIVNHTVAVDPNVIPIGSVLRINGIEYVAEDVGGAVKGNIIDIWVRDKANSFGSAYADVYIKK